MPRKTALEKSIEHWEKNYWAVDTNVGKEIRPVYTSEGGRDFIINGNPFNIGGDACALCAAHGKNECSTCIIYKKTGSTQCGGTPWSTVLDVLNSAMNNSPFVVTPNLVEATHCMLWYLKALLPNKVKSKK